MPPKRRSRGHRSSEQEIRKRVDDIYGLVVDGLPNRVIHEFVQQNCTWSVHRTTLGHYIRRAQKTFAEHSEVERAIARGEARLRLNRIFVRAVQAHALFSQLGAMDRLIRLDGIAAPEKHEFSGPGGVPLGATIEELNAKFIEMVENQARHLRHDTLGETVTAPPEKS